MALPTPYLTANAFGTLYLDLNGRSIRSNTTPADLWPITLPVGHPAGDMGVTKDSRLPAQTAPGLNTTVKG
jgi:hypothetical protein